MTGQHAQTPWAPLLAALHVGDVVALIVLSALIIGLGYGQVMFQPGYTFKRHLITSAVIAAALGTVALAAAFIRFVF